MDVITELQQQRESLKQNIHDMDESIKKLTGRDPTEARRLSTPNSKRVQLKRNSFGSPGDNQPNKRLNTERRRWGSTALTRPNNLDSGGEEQEEKKPAVQSSVVVTGKPIESTRPVLEDNATKKRNKRMFGLLMGTLKQFKKESQVKTEQDTKREEKLIKVEEQVQKDKDDAVVERRVLFETRRGKQQELRNIEFKIEMAELNEELNSYYGQIKDFIQLKSTPRIFYKPAEHNEKTLKLLKESKDAFQESLHQRMREIGMCTEEDLIVTGRTFRRNKQPTIGKSAKDPIIIDQAPSKRDLFAEDADIDQQERADVIMEEPVEPVLIADEKSADKIPVDKPNEGKSPERVNSKVTVNNKGFRAFLEDVNEDVLRLPVMENDVQIGEVNNDDEPVRHRDVQTSVETVVVSDEPMHDTNDIDHPIVVEDGSENVKDVCDIDQPVELDPNRAVERDDSDRNIVQSDEIDNTVEKSDDIENDGSREGSIDVDDDSSVKDVPKDTEIYEPVQGCSNVNIEGQPDLFEESHSNIFEQLQESNSEKKDDSPENNEDLSKIDDSYLHDEYAALLLEQAVDEERATLSNTSNVNDDRSSNLSRRLKIFQNTKYHIDDKTEKDNLHNMSDNNKMEGQLQEGNESSPKNT